MTIYYSFDGHDYEYEIDTDEIFKRYLQDEFGEGWQKVYDIFGEYIDTQDFCNWAREYITDMLRDEAYDDYQECCEFQSWKEDEGRYYETSKIGRLY